MKPQLDGSFITNQAAEEFTLTIENKKLRLNYKTPYSSWQETILEAEDSVMVVENQDGTIYKYKKFRGFDLNLWSNTRYTIFFSTILSKSFAS